MIYVSSLLAAAALFFGASAQAQVISWNGLPNNFPGSRYCAADANNQCAGTVAWNKQQSDPPDPPNVYVISLTSSDQYTGAVTGGGYPGEVVYCGYHGYGGGVGSMPVTLTKSGPSGYVRIYRYSFWSVWMVINANNQSVPATCNNVAPYAFSSASYQSLGEQDVIIY